MIVGMNIKRLSFLLLFAALCLISGPTFRLGSASQEAVQLQKPLQHEVSVTLKLVQVYVTDKKGKPVQDLQKSDFIVYDKGQRKEITDFEKHILNRPPVKAEPQPAEEKIVPTTLPPGDQVPLAITRKFFLFLDFAFNNQQGVNKSKEAALHFIDTELSPGDQVGLLSYSMLKGLSIHEYLTTNHRKVREAVEVINAKDIAGRAEDIEEEYWRQATEGSAGGGESSSPFQANPPIFDWRRQESKNLAQNFILKMTTLAKAFRTIPGQKHFILFSAGIASSLLYGNQAGTPQGSASGGRSKFDAGDYVLRTQYEEMLKELNSANCAIYTFDTREAAMVPSLFAYDEQTFGVGRTRDIFTRDGVSQTNQLIFKDDKITGGYSLQRLSNTTGGNYYSNIRKYRENLEQVQNFTSSYYVLGYYINEQWDGRYHEIKVEVKRKGCEVRAQAGYFNPKPFREYSDLEKQLHLLDLALTERPLLQTPQRFSVAALSYAAGDKTHLQVLSKIPPETVEKFLGKSVELVSLVFDEKENLVSLQRTEVDLTKYRGVDVFYTSAASLQPGQYQCRFVIRDLNSGNAAVGTARASVAKKASFGLSLHSPLLLIPESNFAYLEPVATKKIEITAWKTMYPYDRAQYSPLIGEAPKGTTKLFAVVPCSIAGLVLPEIVMTADLINSASGERIPLAGSILDRVQKESGEAQFLELLLNNIPPGKYLLYLHAEAAGTKYVSYTKTSLTIK